MAQFDVSTLTLNPEEQREFAKFVYERLYNDPAFSEVGTVVNGVTMNQQLVFAGALSHTGIDDSACARPNSAAAVSLVQKNTTPVGIGDTLAICQNDVNMLFKAYYSKIKNFREMYDITGSDEQVFLAIRLTEAAQRAAQRIAWLGDTATAQSGVATPGVNAAALVKFYSPLSGLWKKIFTAVTATTIQKYAITENSGVTIAAQKIATDKRASEIFEGMWELADPRLKAQPNKQILVSGGIYENYRKELQDKSIYTTMDNIMNGFPVLMWNGCKIINMSSVWDTFLQADWEATSAGAAYYIPNRALLTVKENLAFTTLSESDITSVETHYDWIARTFYLAYGFTLDALQLEDYMCVAAY